MLVLDGHAHCGLTLPYSMLAPLWDNAGIDGGVLFAPVEEIYDRNDPTFVDSEQYKKSRRKVHDYLASIISDHIFIFWFVWNDYTLPGENFTGVKWHRHLDEPQYDYTTPKCDAFIEYACSRRLPVILEEEFENTLQLIERINGETPVIIPHLGMLNGGYHRLKTAGLFENPAVYVDTALAPLEQIADFAADYGVERILFGSDFPFGNPARERNKVDRLFKGKALEKVLSLNLLSLLEK